MNKTNPLIKKYGKEKRWVNYSLMPREGRITKIPFSPITKKNASSMKASDWGTFKEALEVNKDQIGIVFTEEKLLLGIDIDHCLNDNQIEHEQKEQIVQLLIESDTYTEISPSKTGLHLYFGLTGPLGLEANRSGNFECYTQGRYFTVTGNSYKEEKDVRTITQEEALCLLKIIGYPWSKHSDESISKIESISTKQKLSDSGGSKKINLDSETILKKMFSSQNGEKIKNLYVGDTSEYKKDSSSADMALLAHLAFWTRRNAQQMEEIWLASPLGKREKTLTRKDYRDRSIQKAIDNCKEIYESSSMKIETQMNQEAPELNLLFSTYKGEKIFTQNTENICRILRSHPKFKDRFRYDAFKNTFEFAFLNPVQVNFIWRDFQDHDTIDIQTEISILFPCFAKVGKEMIYDAIIKVSKENEIDSAMDWVKTLQWDNTLRLDTWLSKTYSVVDDVYHRAVASNWFKGLVKRLIEPGCKFDHVLVLEGEQGIKKSTSLAILGSPFPNANWHVETAMSTDNKDFFMQFQGKAIIEFSEGETLSRTEVKRMKAIITMQFDKFRPPYGRMSVDFPRRCVFAMTTNQEEYLKDETGNRRWLPVACIGIANIDWLKENIKQLYAEAYYRITILKETVWEFPEEEMRLAQNSRRIHDPNEDNIAHWYFNKLKPLDREVGITTYQVFRDVYCNGMTPQKGLDKFTEMAIAGVLRDSLKLDNRRKMVDGVQGKRWFASVLTKQGALPIPETEEEKVYNSF